MILKQLYLKKFRNFKENKFDFNPFITLIIGKNARGKTNLLEGIYTLINTEGFREKKEEELIFFEEEKMMIEGRFAIADEVFVFKIIFKKKERGVEKKFFVNKVEKKLSFYLNEQTKTILFTPQQLEIIIGEPEKRREYFNKLISSFDFEYKKRLINYEKALTHRNKILATVFDEKKLNEEIVFWNDYLINQGSYLTKKRQEFVDFFNCHQELDKKNFFIRYEKNEFTSQRLKEYFSEERRLKKTVIGPQKDDFQIFIKKDREKNVHRFGSRSEQRLAIVWLKFNEINFYEQKMSKKPLLLLDDIFSELDGYNKKIILNLIKKYQTIATTTDIEILNLINLPKSVIML